MRSRLPPLAIAAVCLAGCATATDASPPVAAPQTVPSATHDDIAAGATPDATVDDRDETDRSDEHVGVDHGCSDDACGDNGSGVER